MLSLEFNIYSLVWSDRPAYWSKLKGVVCCSVSSWDLGESQSHLWRIRHVPILISVMLSLFCWNFLGMCTYSIKKTGNMHRMCTEAHRMIKLSVAIFVSLPAFLCQVPEEGLDDQVAWRLTCKKPRFLLPVHLCWHWQSFYEWGGKIYSANTQYTKHTRRANTPAGLEDNTMFMIVMTGYQKENSVKVSMFHELPWVALSCVNYVSCMNYSQLQWYYSSHLEWLLWQGGIGLGENWKVNFHTLRKF